MPNEPGNYVVGIDGQAEAAREREEIAAMVWEGLVWTDRSVAPAAA